MRIQGKVWHEGIYRGTFELYPIWDARGNEPAAIVILGDVTYVAVRRAGKDSAFEVLFPLEAIDHAMGYLRKDQDAEAVGPVTLSLEAAYWDPPSL